jgi:hypothetical protein
MSANIRSLNLSSLNANENRFEDDPIPLMPNDDPIVDNPPPDTDTDNNDDDDDDDTDVDMDDA